MRHFEVSVIDSLDRMASLRPQWDDLFARAISPTVFGSWEWQYLAAKHLAMAKNVIIAAVFDEDTLAAVLPLRQSRIRLGGIISTDVLSCLGGGITDYNTLIVDQSSMDMVLPVLARFVKERNQPIQIENVLPGSALDSWGQYLAEHGFLKAEVESKTALISELESDYENFLHTRKKKFRKTLRENQNYMDRTGGYTYHTENPSEELLETLVRLHSARWQMKGEQGALAQRQIIDFHTDLMNMADRSFDICYYTIRHEGAVVAILYGFLREETFYAYLSGFNIQHNRISPGNMIINYCVRELLAAGVRTLDMLRGDMKYKQTWATAAVPMIDAVYFPSTGKGRFLHGATRMIQTAKRAMPTRVKQNLKALLSRRPAGESDMGRTPEAEDE